jgi:CDP-6-deoxy-D-xylo-4-hexulose-3-dehydrase
MIDKAIRSFRDWGRDCWCLPGCDNTCGIRFDHDWEDLPYGYDHKYVYSEIGYNLKATDIQAAIGNSQLRRLSGFVDSRRHNWDYYRKEFGQFEENFILPEPQRNSVPSWFGFALTLRDDTPFTRTELTQYLEDHKIGTRNLFGGNLLRQPAYKDVPKRVVGAMRYADVVTERTFWIGIHPGITQNKQEYVIDTVKTFIEEHK